MPRRPAVFLDRDGCLNEEVGYLNHVSRVRLLPGAAPAVRRLNEAGVAAVVATNQTGVARGYFPADVLEAVNREVVRQLALEGARLDGFYVCPHHPEHGEPPYRQVCECRKPRPGLLLRAARELDLDLAASVMVGDKISDVACGHAAGAAGVLVLTGYGRGEWEHRRAAWAVVPDHIAADVSEAVVWALAHRAGARAAARA